MHGVAARGERCRIRARSATDIDHRRWRPGRVALDQLPRPERLELRRPALEAVLLRSALVVSADLRVDAVALGLALLVTAQERHSRTPRRRQRKYAGVPARTTAIPTS